MRFTHHLEHWRTSIWGILGGAIISTATIADFDKLTPMQVSLAFIGAVCVALQGISAADARQAPAVAVDASPAPVVASPAAPVEQPKS